jgi:response regulator NasT
MRSADSVDKYKDALNKAHYSVIAASTSGMELLRDLAHRELDIAVVGMTLCDMAGIAFACDLIGHTSCSVLMVVPPEQIEYVSSLAGDRDIVCIARPVNAQALCASIDTMLHYRRRLKSLSDEADILRDKIQSRALAEKAKTALMNRMKMTESEAWKFLQKRSMDSGKTMQEVAKQMLDFLNN